VLGRRTTAEPWQQEGLRIVLRDSFFIFLAILVGLWFIPFISHLLFFGSVALTIPLLLLALVLSIVLASVRQIHGQLFRTFGQTLLGEEYTFKKEAPAFQSRTRGRTAGILRRVITSVRFGRLWPGRRVKTEESDQESESGDSKSSGIR